MTQTPTPFTLTVRPIQLGDTVLLTRDLAIYRDEPLDVTLGTVVAPNADTLAGIRYDHNGQVEIYSADAPDDGMLAVRWATVSEGSEWEYAEELTAL